MVISDTLRNLREQKKFSQGDIEKRHGIAPVLHLTRGKGPYCIPAIETVEKLARAMEVPLYQLFYDGERPPKLPNLPERKTGNDVAWGSSGKDAKNA
jgi:transcriptional regulator with XRE-family HTH domain